MKELLIDKMNNEKREIILCACHSTNHQMVFLYDHDDKPEQKMLFAHVLLNRRPFLKRIGIGLRYIFGYRSRYGAFDEFIFNPKDVDKLQDVVDFLKAN